MESVINLNKIQSLTDAYKKKNFELSVLRKERNSNAMRIKDSGISAETKKAVIDRGKTLRALISSIEHEMDQISKELMDEAKMLPNDIHPETPIGDESCAITIKTVNKPRTSCGNAPLKDHIELGALHHMFDFERAGKISASSFYFLKEAGALLEMALSRFAMDICLAHGFIPVLTPDVIRYDLVEGCGFKPRSKDPQTYFVNHECPDSKPQASTGPQLCLTATAEFPMAGMYANETLTQVKPSEPIKMVALGRAFRAEGLAGATNRGLYRVHQFSKVEMFGLTTPQDSDKLFKEFLEIQDEIYSGLELCFRLDICDLQLDTSHKCVIRILKMPSEELGAPAYQKYDMEAWMPARKAWGEISSTSNCTDYQARRLGIKYLTGNQSSPTDYVHTVNGTAAAVPRLILALVETHQTSDGHIRIPKRLRPYFLGKDIEILEVGKTMAELVRRKQT